MPLGATSSHTPAHFSRPSTPMPSGTGGRPSSPMQSVEGRRPSTPANQPAGTSQLVAPQPGRPGSTSPEHLRPPRPDADGMDMHGHGHGHMEPNDSLQRSSDMTNKLMTAQMVIQTLQGLPASVKGLADTISPPPGAQGGAGAPGAQVSHG